MEIIIALQRNIVPFYNACIPHNGASTGRFRLNSRSLRFERPRVVGAKLMTEFVCYVIQIEHIPFWNVGGGKGTTLSIIHTDRGDKTSVTIVQSHAYLMEQMPNIIVFFSNNGCNSGLYLRIQTIVERIGIGIGKNKQVVIGNEFQGDAQIGLEYFVDPG